MLSNNVKFDMKIYQIDKKKFCHYQNLLIKNTSKVALQYI